MRHRQRIDPHGPEIDLPSFDLTPILLGSEFTNGSMEPGVQRLPVTAPLLFQANSPPGNLRGVERSTAVLVDQGDDLHKQIGFQNLFTAAFKKDPEDILGRGRPIL
ncbi:hypothetical protein [Streptomyces sp. 147326]|uniref:hypothetical protein n=1 Tax=Streptomyces sp. 147326 TaxID=3074379 RepID=UPI0038574440